PVDVTYLADTVILLRYFEAMGRVRRAISVIKKRTSAHEDTIREYRIGKSGITLGPPLTNFQGVLRGVPEMIGAGEGLLQFEAAGLGRDLRRLSAWIRAQPEWSDLPFIVLTRKGGGLERNPEAGRLLEALGNVTFLERPFHPTTLVSPARAALRARLRQYDARARLEELQASEERLRNANETLEAR